jgi:hypothetical protein
MCRLARKRAGAQTLATAEAAQHGGAPRPEVTALTTRLTFSPYGILTCEEGLRPLPFAQHFHRPSPRRQPTCSMAGPCPSSQRPRPYRRTSTVLIAASEFLSSDAETWSGQAPTVPTCTGERRQGHRLLVRRPISGGATTHRKEGDSYVYVWWEFADSLYRGRLSSTALASRGGSREACRPRSRSYIAVASSSALVDRQVWRQVTTV